MVGNKKSKKHSGTPLSIGNLFSQDTYDQTSPPSSNVSSDSEEASPTSTPVAQRTSLRPPPGRPPYYLPPQQSKGPFNMDKDIVSSSSNAAMPAANAASSSSAPNTGSASSVEQLKEVLKKTSLYFYFDKPLSTDKDTSVVNQAAYYVPGASMFGARVRTTKYHMLDADYKNYRDAYEAFLIALYKVDPQDNAKLQAELIEALKSINKSLKAKYYNSSRYITLQTQLFDLFFQASKNDDKSILCHLINEAQTFHQNSSIPIPTGDNDKSTEIAAYIQLGATSPRKQLILDTLAEVPVKYNDAKKPLAYNQLDAQLAVSSVELDDYKRLKTSDNLDLIHQLHSALGNLLKIHSQVGIPDDHTKYINQITEEQETLEHYRTAYKNQSNKTQGAQKLLTLPEISQGIADKCAKLTGPVNNTITHDSPSRKLDPHLALQYMQEISAFAVDKLTMSRLSGIQQELSGIQQELSGTKKVASASSSSQKKISNG